MLEYNIENVYIITIAPVKDTQTSNRWSNCMNDQNKTINSAWKYI